MKSVLFEGRSIYPTKIVCVGRNYVEHIKELGNEMPSSMVLFMKPNSAVTDILDSKEGSLHYEGEISFLIKDLQIAGVGFGLDLTDRALQGRLKEKGLPWERAKAFDKAALFSEFVAIDKDDLTNLSLKLYINAKLKQGGGVELMIYKPNDIISEINSFSTLEDGDIVMSGTPKGVGRFNPGDRFLGEIWSGNKKLISKEWIAL